VGEELGVWLAFVQRNGEGDLVDAVHALAGAATTPAAVAPVTFPAGRARTARSSTPAPYSHTSLRLRDALAGVALPFVEVHVTNVYAREPERRHSMLASAAVGLVCGLGIHGYEVALRGLVHVLRARAGAPA
jgi:3-dehydroquinate dehydratase-2